MNVDRKSHLLEWANRIITVAGSAPQKKPASAAFSDEAGHRRSIDAPLLLWRARRTSTNPSDTTSGTSAEPDVLLWWALTDPAIDPRRVLDEADAPRTSADRGALIPIARTAAIEVWTEREFSCLHALWWLARRDHDPHLIQRVERAVTWHIEHIQPDNATAHPWALHVFLEASIADPQAHDARLYAETLLHNCRVTLGHPDALSREILLDSADALRELAAE